MIPQAQIMSVLHNLNVSGGLIELTTLVCQMREGIFSEEDLQHLENGYSVSETDEERTHLHDGDILSLRSGLSGGNQLRSAYLG